MKKLLGIGLGIMVLGMALMGCGSKDDVEIIVDDGFVETIEVEAIEVEEIEIEEIDIEDIDKEEIIDTLEEMELDETTLYEDITEYWEIEEEEPWVSDEYLEELEYNSQVNRY